MRRADAGAVLRGCGRGRCCCCAADSEADLRGAAEALRCCYLCPLLLLWERWWVCERILRRQRLELV